MLREGNLSLCGLQLVHTWCLLCLTLRSVPHSQLWLYHQHNAVTQRVWADETATATSSPNSAKDMLRSELWPSQGQCETCIGAPSTGEVPGTSVNSGDTANSSAGVSANAIVGGAGSSSQGYDPQSVDGAAVLKYLHTAYFV